MAKTRTTGIKVDANGNRIVDKVVEGERVYKRLGRASQEEAEAILRDAEARIRAGKGDRNARPRILFREVARKYLEENRDTEASIDVTAHHLMTVDPWVGHLPIEEVDDISLEPFKKARAQAVTATTVNHALEVVRRVLNRCVKRWRHPNRRPYLDQAPWISFLPNPGKRQPYPMSWAEQTLLFGKLPKLNAQMALFKVNTGLREQEVCHLEWSWEVRVPELKTSVFIIPAIFSDDGKHGVKNRDERLVVLNDVARSVIEARRGLHDRYVFDYRGHRLDCMNNTAWQSARRKAADAYPEVFGRAAPVGFRNIRVHDMKHTFGRRLRSAGVGEETRAVLLGHRTHSMPTHYSAAELSELIEAVNRIDASRETPAITVLRRAA